MTLPLAPLSRPAMTTTSSPFLIFMSEHLRSQRDDLHELLVAQLATDRSEDAGAPRLVVLLDQHGGVLVEADVRPVRAPPLLRRADDDRLDDIALLHAGTRHRVLDRGDDDVADSRIAPTRAAEHTDAENLLRTRVVGDAQSRFLLDHFAFSTISTSRHRLVADSGRVSMSSTRSPTPAAFSSSCALTLVVERRTLP